MTLRTFTPVPWLLLCGAVACSLFVPFSHRAVNAEALGAHDAGMALFFAFAFPAAIYISLGISALALFLAVLYRSLDRPGCRTLLSAAVVGVLPLLYLLVLDGVS